MYKTCNLDHYIINVIWFIALNCFETKYNNARIITVQWIYLLYKILWQYFERTLFFHGSFVSWQDQYQGNISPLTRNMSCSDKIIKEGTPFYRRVSSRLQDREWIDWWLGNRPQPGRILEKPKPISVIQSGLWKWNVASSASFWLWHQLTWGQS